MVEHNLAKVGVASSNLVSRSIFFLLLLFPPLFSQTLFLDKRYCIKEDSLKASFFGYTGPKDFVVLEIPKDRTYYSVSSNALLPVFEDHNVTLIDSSGGVVIFQRDCALMGKSKLLENAFMKAFQEKAPHVRIEGKPHIFIKHSLPEDFIRYDLHTIELSSTTLRKNNGSFFATFKIANKEKKLYFFYEMNASAPVFKAKHNLHNGKILTFDDYETVWLPLDDIPLRAIVEKIPQNAFVKGTLREGQILAEYHVGIKKMFSKNERIKTLFKEEGLVIEIQATLLNDADVGDVVKIRTEQGKVLSAKIISSKEAVILE